MPITFSISSITFSGLAFGKSILLITGIISKSLSIAKYTLASVWASIPCDASTTNIAPSQAAKLLDTSYVKSTWPGVSIKFNIYSSPSLALYTVLTDCNFIVIPLSLSKSMLSNTCDCISLLVSTPVNSISLSASVDFPWSIWAIIQKFLILLWLLNLYSSWTIFISMYILQYFRHFVNIKSTDISLKYLYF